MNEPQHEHATRPGGKVLAIRPQRDGTPAAVGGLGHGAVVVSMKWSPAPATVSVLLAVALTATDI